MIFLFFWKYFMVKKKSCHHPFHHRISLFINISERDNTSWNVLHFLLKGWTRHPYFLNSWCHTVKKSTANLHPKYTVNVISCRLHSFPTENGKFLSVPSSRTEAPLGPQSMGSPTYSVHDGTVKRLTKCMESEGWKMTASSKLLFLGPCFTVC